MIPFVLNVGYTSTMAFSITLVVYKGAKVIVINHYQGPAKTHNTKSGKIVVIRLSSTCCPVARSNC